MKRAMFSLLTLMTILARTFSVALAGNPFAGETSTGDGYETWDSDMVDIEAVEETGAGVYVAVLESGMAPNWRDFFPEERVATELGTGFVQPLSFKAKQADPCRSILFVPLLQILGIAFVWRRREQMKIWGVALTVILNLAVVISLLAYAQMEMPLRSLLVVNPELGYIGIAIAVIGIGWSVIYAAMNLRMRRSK